MTTPWLLDSSVVIDASERKHPVAIQRLKDLSGPTLRSMVVDAELSSGVLTAQMAGGSDIRQVSARRATLDRYRFITTPCTVYPAESVAEYFAVVTALSAQSGAKCGQNDRWILAEGLGFHATVITSDSAMSSLGAIASEHFGVQVVEFVDSR